MSERKNIDRLFQERFRDFEVTPDEKVWQNIEAELKEKKRRRVIPIWWKVAGVAALLMLGLLIFNRFTAAKTATENAVVNTESNGSSEGNTNENQSVNPGVNTGNNLSENPDSIAPNASGTEPNHNVAPNNLTPKISERAVAVSPAGSGNPQEKISEKEITIQPGADRRKPSAPKKPNAVGQNTNSAIAAMPGKDGRKNSDGSYAAGDKSVKNQGIAANGNNNQSQGNLPADGLNHQPIRQDSQKTDGKLEVQTPQNTGVAANDIELKKDSAVVAAAEPNVLEELLNEKENKVTSREQKINRWQITSNVAPIYFSSVSQGSPLDSRFESNRKSYAPSLSYGVGAKYNINKKFAIKSGVNALALEYNTNDVVFYQTENARMIENLKPNMAGSFVQVENKPEANAVTTMSRARSQYSGEVNQKIGYVEVPVEMTYQLLDKKFGMELIGGVSTLFLNRNEVSLVSPGLDMTIGEADNLNSVHFSTNVGVGFRYNFLKSFQANVEPMFKYQINTFSNDSGNFKPFFFGLYTGVSYRF